MDFGEGQEILAGRGLSSDASARKAVDIACSKVHTSCMTDMQRIVDALSEAERQQRSNYHMTLGELIAALEMAQPDIPVITGDGTTPGDAMSYRGYYSDLAFEPSGESKTAGQFLAECQAALGHTFTGYKGGDFTMGEDTPLWISHEGSASGIAIVGGRVVPQSFVLETKAID